MGIDRAELGKIETRRRPVDIGDVEPLDGLLVIENFIVAMRPAETCQIIAHGFRQVAQALIIADRLRAVALAELGAIGAMDQRNMREDRHLPIERHVNQALAGGIIEMVVAADDVGNTHVMIIDHDGQIIGRRAVRTQQDQVVHVLRIEGNITLHRVRHHQRIGQRSLEADDVRLFEFGLRWRAIAPGRAQGVAGFAGFLAGDFGFFLRHEAGIGAAFGQQIVHRRLMALFAGVLEDDGVIRFKAQPVKPLENGVHRCTGRAFAIGILDTDKELATGVFGVKPVEQGRARAADMQISGR